MGRVTTRNFLKSTIESFQDLRLIIGVPKGTNDGIFASFVIFEAVKLLMRKCLKLHLILSLFYEDRRGQEKTQKDCIGLRIGYESPTDAHPKPYPIISSAFLLIHFKKISFAWGACGSN